MLPDDYLLNAKEAGALADLLPASISTLRRRGRLPSRQLDGTWYYRVGDVLSLSRPGPQRRSCASCG